MAILDSAQLRTAITAAGANWRVRDVPVGERPRALGWRPSSLHTMQAALTRAHLVMLLKPSLPRPATRCGDLVRERSAAPAP